MSRSKRFLSGLGLSYVFQALTMLAALWMTPFLLHHIGQHSYGLWLVGLQILSYVMLMDFGIVALVPRETAYATGREISGAAAQELPAVIGRSIRVVLYQTPLVAFAVAILWFFMPPTWNEFRGPLMVVLCGFTLLFPLRVFQAVLQGLQDLAFFTQMQMISWSLSTVLTIALVLHGYGLYALSIGWLAMQVIGTALAWSRLLRRFPSVLPRSLPRLPGKELFRSLTSGFWVSTSQLSTVLIGSTDYLIISRFLGASAVVPYSCTQKLISTLRNQPYMIMEVAAPGLSQMKTSESRERIFQVSSALTLGMLTLAGAVSCITLAVNQSFVYWWLGAGQWGGVGLSLALIACTLLRHWNTTLVYALFALGHERRISITNLLDGLATLVFGVVLARWIGTVGAPLGAIAAVCFVSLPGNLLALAREVEVKVLDIIRAIWPWIWRFVLLAAGSGLLGLRHRANLPYLILVVGLTTAVYGLVMIPVLLNSQMRWYLPSAVTRWWDRFTSRLTFGSPVSQDSTL